MNYPMITRLRIKRFRSIQAADLSFGDITFLVGENGAGKSNLVDSLTFLADAATIGLNAAFEKRGGVASVRSKRPTGGKPYNLGLAVEIKQPTAEMRRVTFGFELRSIERAGYEVIREQGILDRINGDRIYYNRRGSTKFETNASGGLAPALEPTLLALPILGGDLRFRPLFEAVSMIRTYQIEPAQIRTLQDPDSGEWLRHDGSNAASVLGRILADSPEVHVRLIQLLSRIIPGVTDLTPKQLGNKLTIEFSQNWGNSRNVLFDAFSMSDGTLRALGLLLAVFQLPHPTVLVIEEPEATIHPGALATVLDIIHHADRNMQVILTTHSPDLLDVSWIRDDQIRIVEREGVATYVAPLSKGTRQSLQERLMGAGEMLRADALLPAPKVELFLPDPASVHLFESDQP